MRETGRVGPEYGTDKGQTTHTRGAEHQNVITHVNFGETMGVPCGLLFPRLARFRNGGRDP